MSAKIRFSDKKRTISLAVIFSFFTPLTLNAAPLPTQTLQVNQWALTNQADQAIQQYQSENNVPGMSVAICKNGNFLYSKGFGWSNVEKKIAASQNTRYRLASVSKPVTGILAMELRDKGQLQTNSNIRTFLPGLPIQHNYTLGQLLSHQSGVRHYKNGYDPTKNVNINFGRAQDALQLFINDPLVISPGSNYSYSTHGYTVLAAAIEKITNNNFAPYASSRFNAWGLPTLRPENAAIPLANRAEIYGTNNKPAQRDNLSQKYAGGGYESSVVDLCKLGMKVVNGNILTPASRNLMWTKQQSQARLTNYGFGWNVGTDGDRKVVAHNGAQTGAASYWRIYPDDGVVVVVLSNRRGHNPRQLGINLGKMAVQNTTQFMQSVDNTIQFDDRSVDE
jgi:serine beta-lactamase-like protein LACTB, mitochondrial